MLEILKKTGRFSKYITTWNALGAADKTWPRLKIHFNTARREMKDYGELDNVTANQFQQANAIKEVIFEGVTEAFQAHTPAFPFVGHAFGGLGGFPYCPPVTDNGSQEAPPSTTPSSSGDNSSKLTDPFSAFYSMSKDNIDRMTLTLTISSF